LLIDIDRLKTVNERSGREAGDRLLKMTAREIMSAARLSDFTYRFGGEEFVVLSDGLAGADALALAERIRHAVMMASAADPGGKITVSIGVASCPADGAGYEALFMTAAGRLAEAKALGGNQVIGRREPAFGV